MHAAILIASILLGIAITVLTGLFIYKPTNQGDAEELLVMSTVAGGILAYLVAYFILDGHALSHLTGAFATPLIAGCSPILICGSLWLAFVLCDKVIQKATALFEKLSSSIANYFSRSKRA